MLVKTTTEQCIK